MGNGGDVMAGDAPQAGVQVNQGLVVGGVVLVGLGGLLGATGIMLLTTAIVSAARRWMRQLERPPRETARLRWEQAKAATSAGAEAWRSGVSTRPSGS
jgi:hypothetical protein